MATNRDPNGAGDATNPMNQRITELLEALLRLQMAPLLEKELADVKSRELFEATGELTAQQLAKKLHMSKPTICAKWKRWEQLGIITKDRKSYRKVV